MIRLTKEQIIILDSALNAPFQGYGTVDAFPSLQQKAARLGYGLI